MTNVIMWAIIIFIVLGVVSKSFNSIQKSAAKMQNHAKCEACHGRLKAINGKYGTTCPKCAHVQSWAGA